MPRATLVRGLVTTVFLGSLTLGGGSDGPAGPAPPPKPALRRPVALTLADGGRLLFVANRCGTVTAIDAEKLCPAGETAVGRRLADLVATPDGRHLLAVDEGAGELLVLSPRLETLHRVPVGAAPVSVQAAPDGSCCFVASLWSRRLVVIDLGPLRPRAGDGPRVTKTIALPFAPRRQLPVGGPARLVVADAFGGRLAVVEPARGTVASVRTLPGHNIRGLALSADRKELLLAHQVLNPLARTTQDDIHWGNLLTNNLRALPLADVLKPDADLLRGGRLFQLGEAGHGTGDPAGVAVAGGELVVPLAGVGEAAVGPDKEGGWAYVPVGAGPAAVATSPDGRRAYVANTFADLVSVIDVPGRKVRAEVSLGPRPEPTAADRGERLFHDARLAHDGWFSCQSCHTDGHSNGLLADTLGDNSYGTPKRVLSLRGVKDTGPWAWNGSMPDLESQVRKSVLTTMHGRKPTAEQVADLVAYLKTLPPPPPPGPADEAAVGRGREVFHRQGCAACHPPPSYTSPRTYDVGLSDEAGQKEFNPPSLRGVSQGGPYFHDGRAATLVEVFTRHRHQLKGELAKGDVEDLLAFLRSL
jgi:YVTN family beta-propeller protein